MEITIKLTPQELDLIGIALGKLPYEQSYKLIAKLTQQYNNYKTKKIENMENQRSQEEINKTDKIDKNYN